MSLRAQEVHKKIEYASLHFLEYKEHTQTHTHTHTPTPTHPHTHKQDGIRHRGGKAHL